MQLCAVGEQRFYTGYISRPYFNLTSVCTKKLAFDNLSVLGLHRRMQYAAAFNVNLKITLLLQREQILEAPDKLACTIVGCNLPRHAEVYHHNS